MDSLHEDMMLIEYFDAVCESAPEDGAACAYRRAAPCDDFGVASEVAVALPWLSHLGAGVGGARITVRGAAQAVVLA